MRHLFTAIVTAVEAVAVALISLIVVAVAALLMWFGPLNMQPEAVAMFRSVASVWGLAHGIPINIAPSEQFLLSLDMKPGLVFSLSLIPLTLTAITVFLGTKIAARITSKTNLLAAAIILFIAVLGFAAVSFTILFAVTWFKEPPTAISVLIATSFFAIPVLITFFVKKFTEFTNLIFLNSKLVTVLRFAPRVFKLTIVMALIPIIVSCFGFVLSILLKYPSVARLNQLLQLDIFGELFFLLMQLAFLPVLLIWAVAWFSGVGFSIGIGSLVDPIETLLGPIPVFPLFGLIPEGLTKWGILPIIFLILTAIIGGLIFGTRPEYKNPKLLTMTLIAVVAAFFFMIIFATLAGLASGSIGPGRMEFVGVNAWRLAIVLTLEVGLGFFFGLVLIRLPGNTKQLKTVFNRVFVKNTPSKTSTNDTAETVEIDRDNVTTETSRIADPKSDSQKPWFHKGKKSSPKKPKNLTLDEDPNFDEERLIEEYSWETLVSQENEKDETGESSD